MRPQDRLLIPEARLVDEAENTLALVQPQSNQAVGLRPGRIAYDHGAHQGRLRCPYCSLKVVFNKGAEVTGAGNLHGPSPHFQKLPHTRHDESCLIPMRDPRSPEDDKIDYTLGYRLRFNILPVRDMFRRASGRYAGALYNPPVYDRGSDGKLRIVHPDLIRREGFTIKSADDVLRFMRRGDFSRIKDTKLNILHSVYPWDRVMILPATKQDRAVRYRDLVKRLLDGVVQPCALYVDLARGGRGTSIDAKSIFLGRDAQNRVHFLSPRFYLDDPSARDCFTLGGGYLVIGVPRIKSVAHRNSVNHKLSLSVRSVDQVAACHLPTLVETARKNQARRLSPAV